MCVCVSECVYPVEVDIIRVREPKRKLRLKERDVDGSSCGGEVKFPWDLVSFYGTLEGSRFRRPRSFYWLISSRFSDVTSEVNDF